MAIAWGNAPGYCHIGGKEMEQTALTAERSAEVYQALQEQRRTG
jgi:hypothetical protein